MTLDPDTNDEAQPSNRLVDRLDRFAERSGEKSAEYAEKQRRIKAEHQEWRRAHQDKYEQGKADRKTKFKQEKAAKVAARQIPEDPSPLGCALAIVAALAGGFGGWHLANHFGWSDGLQAGLTVALGALAGMLGLGSVLSYRDGDSTPAVRTLAPTIGNRPQERTALATQLSQPLQRVIVDSRDAELAMVEWMRWLGFPDAHRNPVGVDGGADGGFDIISSRALGEVKFRKGAMGRKELQQLQGEASAQALGGVYFSHGGYASTATTWADQPTVQMPLFSFTELNGLTPENRTARALYAEALQRDLAAATE